MDIQREWAFGPHKAHFEEPDLLIVRMGGQTGLADAQALTELYRELGTQRPFFAIINVKDSSTDAAARSYFTREINLDWFLGVVYVSAGVIEKALGKAMTVAFYFTGRTKTDFLYAPTLEEARILVDQMRAKPPSR